MNYCIRRAVVIGAGTMGAGIAAHLANIGVRVSLLDLPPSELSAKEKRKGLTLDHPAVRNRMAEQGLGRVQAARTPGFYLPRFRERTTTGNVVDHFDRVAEADWIIEAIYEDLELKRRLMARIDRVRQPQSIVSTNTSGLSLRKIALGLSDNFQAHFLGTHFFNPPRLMKLLEIIPGPKTDPAVLQFMIRYAGKQLGKEVVVCKDTPNFIANRLAAMQGNHDMEYAVSHGFRVEETDAILGPLIGRPTTAVFRLLDLVGLDVSTRVKDNLYHAIPQDPFRPILKAPAISSIRHKMIESGRIGKKSGQGFYRQVETQEGTQYWALDFERMEYHQPKYPSLDEAWKIKDLPGRLRFLMKKQDRVGQMVWASLKNCLAYAAYCLPEIADELVSIDRAMRWGYSWEFDPFEIWDALGVSEIAARMRAEGQPVAEWVTEMVDRGFSSFYQRENGELLYYDLRTEGYLPLKTDPRRICISDLKTHPGRVIRQNPSASLIDMGEGVACLIFHTRPGVLDDNTFELIEGAREEVERNFLGLVIGISGECFSRGSNLQLLLKRAREGQFDRIEASIRRAQDAHMALRFCSRPVVAACQGSAIAGGAEIAMAATRVCATAESYLGLIEPALGLVPAGGGCKELLRRVVSPPMRTPQVDPEPFVRQVFETLFQSKRATSAYEARAMGLLSQADPILMRESHLLASAKDLLLALVSRGYQPPTLERSIFVAGERTKASLEISLFLLKEAGLVTEHQTVVGRKLIYILCGGPLTTPQWVEEPYILDLEREAFLSLCGEPATQTRIETFLTARKKLRH